MEKRFKNIVPGHTYDLKAFDNQESVQRIQFIHKENDEKENKLVTVKDGTTNEAVIEMLIDRLEFLNNKLPSRETSLAITKLEECLMWLDVRTKKRIAAGVKGTHQQIPESQDPDPVLRKDDTKKKSAKK